MAEQTESGASPAKFGSLLVYLLTVFSLLIVGGAVSFFSGLAKKRD